MKQFLIALQFLTILPAKVSGINEKDFGKSLAYFPIVGMLIGSFLALSFFVFGFLPSLVYAGLILIISIIITGGIHLDGFADTCDGFYGSKPREERLRIMRDSHIGTMGVSGIACLLLLKFTIFASMPKEVLWKILILTATFARWTQSLSCLFSNYARDNGKAKSFIEGAKRKEVIVGGFFTLALFLLLTKFAGLILFVIPLIFILFFINYVKRTLGGATGDTIGATNELAEVLILLGGQVFTLHIFC